MLSSKINRQGLPNCLMYFFPAVAVLEMYKIKKITVEEYTLSLTAYFVVTQIMEVNVNP